MAQVTIVGAGMAGLAAALRLLERGVSVTLLEQDDFLGGKLGAHRHGPGAGDYHEHSYHMYLNWYNNFWQIVDEAGLDDAFAAQHSLFYLRRRRGALPEPPVEMVDVGAPASAVQNLFSGLRGPLDMFIYSYSLIDLLATPSWRHARLEQTSVLGFMNGRGYNTDAAMAIEQDMLAKAFACPSWLTSARSYQRFIGFGFQAPSPAMWLMRGNTQELLFAPLLAHLHRIAARTGATFDVRLLHRVRALRLDRTVAVRAVEGDELRRSPSTDEGRRPGVQNHFREEIGDALILAVPAGPLGTLVDEHVYAHAPALADVRRLESQPMASLDLVFRRRLPGVPAGITNLLGSRHGLSFLDLSQAWDRHPPDGANTALNVVASELTPIAGFDNATIARLMIDELARYLAFAPDDIDPARTHLNKNLAEPLFTNQVGSWRLRPRTECGIPNLFLAGDFCRNPIDVVTIEGAVVSGLQAAEAVRSRLGAGDPIEIALPPELPETTPAAMRLAGEPLAYAAKTLSVTEHWLRDGWREMFPKRS